MCTGWFRTHKSSDMSDFPWLQEARLLHACFVRWAIKHGMFLSEFDLSLLTILPSFPYHCASAQGVGSGRPHTTADEVSTQWPPPPTSPPARPWIKPQEDGAARAEPMPTAPATPTAPESRVAIGVPVRLNDRPPVQPPRPSRRAPASEAEAAPQFSRRDTVRSAETTPLAPRTDRASSSAKDCTGDRGKARAAVWIVCGRSGRTWRRTRRRRGNPYDRADTTGEARLH
jgi:hypothetical protein